MGEDFRSDHAANSRTALVNESFVRAFGVESPLGMTIGQAVALHEPGYDIPDDLKGLMIRGVTEDFQFAPLAFGVFSAIFHVQATTVFSRMLIRVLKAASASPVESLRRE